MKQMGVSVIIRPLVSIKFLANRNYWALLESDTLWANSELASFIVIASVGSINFILAHRSFNTAYTCIHNSGVYVATWVSESKVWTCQLDSPFNHIEKHLTSHLWFFLLMHLTFETIEATRTVSASQSILSKNQEASIQVSMGFPLIIIAV